MKVINIIISNKNKEKPTKTPTTKKPHPIKTKKTNPKHISHVWGQKALRK